MKRIAIFASGSGSNAENIIKYFQDSTNIRVQLVISNKEDSKVLNRAISHGVDSQVFSKLELEKGDVLTELKYKKIDFIVLAGFLLKIPKQIINKYKNKIVNIHPSLLPLYGGIGMYGINVHRKVSDSKDEESGITIHYVNNHYDKGQIIFQAKCPLYPNIKPKEIQKKVHKLEIKFFPRIIQNLLDGKN